MQLKAKGTLFSALDGIPEKFWRECTGLAATAVKLRIAPERSTGVWPMSLPIFTESELVIIYLTNHADCLRLLA